MSLQTSFLYILQSLSLEGSGVAHFAHDKFAENELSLFLKHGVLAKGSDAEYVTCLGCEMACYKKVEFQRQRGKREVHAFIVCTEPEDGGGENVDLSRLVQYQSSRAGLVQMVIQACGDKLASSIKEKQNCMWELGVFSGKKHKAVLSLDFKRLKALVNETELEMCELLGFEEKRSLTFDARKIEQCVDTGFTSATGEQKTAVRKSKTKEMYEAWSVEARKIQKDNKSLSKNDIARKIAKLPMAQQRDYRTIANNLDI